MSRRMITIHHPFPDLDALAALDWHLEMLTNDRWMHTHLGQVVHDHKYMRPSRAAVELLAEETAKALREWKPASKIDLIIPAPPSRRRWRKLSDLPRCVAERLAKMLNIACEERGIVRTTRGPLQKDSTTPKQSITQMRDALALCCDVRGKNVLLLDDLLGFGGTMAAMARCVKQGGAASVNGLAFTATRHVPR